MSQQKDIVIIGGGLAGLVSAIHLLRAGLQVTLIEKYAYPRHKVCGEYVSNEVLPYLISLGFDPLESGAKDIRRVQLSTANGKVIEANLPLGGFGMSRFALDKQLVDLALSLGLELITENVTSVGFVKDLFEIKTRIGGEYKAEVAIGAFGKRSILDKEMDREFVKNESPYLAVKAHYKGEFPDDLVALHNFKGGYCGVSKVENDHVNLCYITDYRAFKKYKNLDEFQVEVMARNPHLKGILKNSEMVFDAPLTISQISFSKKQSVEQHVIMCGDSAGMIHPLCGNGMGMAIHSAQLASHAIVDYFSSNVRDRAGLEEGYKSRWDDEFRSRLRAGRVLASLFRSDLVSSTMLNGLKVVPALLPQIIKRTHGRALEAFST